MNVLSDLEEAKRTLRIADHMIYITYPVLKENRLLVKVLEEVYKAVRKTVDTIMGYEYEHKRIKVYSDPKLNMDIFEQKCAVKYNLTPEEIIGIKQIIDLFESHKSSTMEFSRQNKFVIMAEDLRTDSITMLKLKAMLSIAKVIVRKAETAFGSEKTVY
jgi:hypothetical protein